MAQQIWNRNQIVTQKSCFEPNRGKSESLHPELLCLVILENVFTKG